MKSAAMSSLFTALARTGVLSFPAAILFLAGPARGATLLVNGMFDAGTDGWTTIGGAAVITTGDLSDNRYARVPDGALVQLYQKARSPAPQVQVSFDFFTGLMSPLFPSPGAFPDTVFASVYFGAEESAVQPEVFRSGSLLGMFDYDARAGLSALLPGAGIGPSLSRPGWSRFSATVNVPDGQPWLALTFQNLNASGTAADSVFLVDNLEVFSIPEPAAPLLALAVLLTGTRRHRPAAPLLMPLRHVSAPIPPFPRRVRICRKGSVVRRSPAARPPHQSGGRRGSHAP